MKRSRLIIAIIGRILHALLVLVLSYLLFQAVYYAFSLLANELPPGMPRTQDLDVVDDKPSPQEIVCIPFRDARDVNDRVRSLLLWFR